MKTPMARRLAGKEDLKLGNGPSGDFPEMKVHVARVAVCAVNACRSQEAQLRAVTPGRPPAHRGRLLGQVLAAEGRWARPELPCTLSVGSGWRFTVTPSSITREPGWLPLWYSEGITRDPSSPRVSFNRFSLAPGFNRRLRVCPRPQASLIAVAIGRPREEGTSYAKGWVTPSPWSVSVSHLPASES